MIIRQVKPIYSPTSTRYKESRAAWDRVVLPDCCIRSKTVIKNREAIPKATSLIAVSKEANAGVQRCYMKLFR